MDPVRLTSSPDLQDVAGVFGGTVVRLGEVVDIVWLFWHVQLCIQVLATATTLFTAKFSDQYRSNLTLNRVECQLIFFNYLIALHSTIMFAYQ